MLAGFTLIEMLCVIAIIGILAAMLLGAVNRAYGSARNKMWKVQAPAFYDYIEEHLSKYYQSHPNYPLLSARDLYGNAVFDDRIMDFLRCPHVQYFPFAMSDAANKVVFQIDEDWLNNRPHTPGFTNYMVLMKTNVSSR